MVAHIFSEGPIGKLSPQPWLIAPETKIIISALTSEGAEIRFVGGCVRDSFSKESAFKNLDIDIDIATPETPETIARLLKSAGIKVYKTGIKYGTVSAHIKDMKFEITTLRRDIKAYGRHPNVVFTNDWITDAKRRDFTFNAMSVSPEGDVYDIFDGISDLSYGRVRFIGIAEERLNEDILRILRFFRFFGLYGKSPADTEALMACKKYSKELSNLPGERIWNEMSKILLTPKPGEIAELMSNAGIFEYILPEARNIKRISMLGWLETRIYNKLTIKPDALRRLAALIVTNDKGAENLSKRWRLSNQNSLRLVKMAAPKLDINLNINDIDLNRALHKFGSKMISDLALLAWSEELTNTSQQAKRKSDSWEAILEKCEIWKDVKFPLNGKDVIALGIEEGPRVGKILNSVRNLWEKSGFIDGRKVCLKNLKLIVKDHLI
jgi:poly(A) polymerase